MLISLLSSHQTQSRRTSQSTSSTYTVRLSTSNNKLEVKVKVKYFYPPQESTSNMINIQNHDNTFNIEYNEKNILNMYHNNLNKIKNGNQRQKFTNDSHEKGIVETNCTSNHTEFSKSKAESKTIYDQSKWRVRDFGITFWSKVEMSPQFESMVVR